MEAGQRSLRLPPFNPLPKAEGLKDKPALAGSGTVCCSCALSAPEGSLRGTLSPIYSAKYSCFGNLVSLELSIFITIT